MSDLAPMREQVYADPRPKEHFDRFHERARTREPDWAYELTRVITSLYAYTLLRTRAISVEKVPGRGAVILAPNHFSFMDHFLMGCYIRRKVRFMAKSQLFKGPMQFIYTHGGVFPVRRGARDDETFITAKAILAREGAITMYCEGGRSRTGKVAEQAKRGIGRLALETGAPVVPIAIYGSSRVRNWKRLQFPKVTVQYGDAIRWEPIEDPTREQQQAAADQILLEIRALYAGLEQHGRKGVLRRLREQRRTPAAVA
ncbi:MAG TPA: lysophospholipid acyltransferase family protein [Solirubrobacteraceae bacterium]|jgi:1-acyl-sn-glycerol-3-phosphate acyltransferase|nr:lysophospholipid acyltransferase family protein [Solirubrobacteraceae bacterium]